MDKVQSALESKELELTDVTIKGETTQFAGRGRGGGYRGRKGNGVPKTRDSEGDGKEEYLKSAGGCWSVEACTSSTNVQFGAKPRQARQATHCELLLKARQRRP